MGSWYFSIAFYQRPFYHFEREVAEERLSNAILLILVLVQAQVAQSLKASKSKIVFDVGGKRFATTKEALLRFPGTSSIR